MRRAPDPRGAIMRTAALPEEGEGNGKIAPKKSFAAKNSAPALHATRDFTILNGNPPRGGRAHRFCLDGGRSLK